MTHARVGVFRPNTRYDADFIHMATVFPKQRTSLLPCSVHAVVRDPNWLAATREEFAALVANRTWELEPRLPHANIITGKWAYWIKTHSDGLLDR